MITWIQSKLTVFDHHHHIIERWIGFINCNEVGQVYRFDSEHAYGSFFGDRIGSCVDIETAKHQVEDLAKNVGLK